MKYKKITINDSFNAEFDLESNSFFSLKIHCMKKNDETAFNLEMPGTQIGELAEKFSYPAKAVLHEFMDAPGYEVESQSIIPFGTEPKIKRKFEFYPGIVQITDDLKIHPSTIENSLNIDSLNISGDWSHFALPNIYDLSTPLNWIAIKNKNQTIYDSTKVFPIILLKNKNGNILELGSGFDLWRWNTAENYSFPLENDTMNYPKPIAKFKIQKFDNTISVSREILKADEPFPITAKNWRFNWYVAWNQNHNSKICESNKKEILLEIPNIPKCFHARKNKKLLKNALRSQIPKLNNNTLILNNISPSICSNPSHVAKPNLDQAQHWDLMDLIDLWFWANRQIKSTNSDFIIKSSENSWFKELPSYSIISNKLF